MTAVGHLARVTGAALLPHGVFDLYLRLNDRSLPDLDAAPWR